MEWMQDKVVVVTGAGRGLGRAIAQAFAMQGARVATNDLTPINLDETEIMIAQSGGQVKSYLGDVAQKMAVQGILLQIVDDWGRIDIVVNNAAVQPRQALLDMDEWDWRRTVDVNLTGAFFMTQVAGRVMRELGGGVIINIGDAFEGYPDGTMQAAYQASKAALSGLTEAAAGELAPYNIRVLAVLPGLLDTDSTLERFTAESLLTKDLMSPESAAELVAALGRAEWAALNGRAVTLEELQQHIDKDKDGD